MRIVPRASAWAAFRHNSRRAVRLHPKVRRVNSVPKRCRSSPVDPLQGRRLARRPDSRIPEKARSQRKVVRRSRHHPGSKHSSNGRGAYPRPFCVLEELRDLHGVKCSALEQLVTRYPKREAVF